MPNRSIRGYTSTAVLKVAQTAAGVPSLRVGPKGLPEPPEDHYIKVFDLSGHILSRWIFPSPKLNAKHDVIYTRPRFFAEGQCCNPEKESVRILYSPLRIRNLSIQCVATVPRLLGPTSVLPHSTNGG